MRESLKGWCCDMKIALRTEDYSLLRAIYVRAKALPNTATADFLIVNGYVMDDHLHSNDDLQTCFKAGLPHVMKISTKEEYNRATLFLDVLAKRGTTIMHQIIIPMDPVTKTSKYFIFMLLHPISSEHLRVLVAGGCTTFMEAFIIWSLISSRPWFYSHGRQAIKHTNCKEWGLYFDRLG